MQRAELGGKLRRAKVWLVIGTRPEAIKLAPVAAALASRGLRPALLLTGQHPIDPAEFGFGGLEAVFLASPGGGDPHAHVGEVARAALPHFTNSGLVVVQGDTSSALGGALAASQAGVPVAHVEAGLRTHDPSAPWPEEEFRTAIDSIAALLFAPTGLSAANLRREQVTGSVWVTGNTAIDAVLAKAAGLPARATESGKPRLLVTCHRRESWGAGLSSIAAALREIGESAIAAMRFVLHPNPQVAFEMRRLLDKCVGVELLPPLGHAQMLAMMRDADLVLSDSGGMQEEAPTLGVPLLVLRRRTERPEAIASGNIELVGTDRAAIVAAVRRLLGDPAALAAMRVPSAPYGDGRASERIADAILDWIDERGVARPANENGAPPPGETPLSVPADFDQKS